MRAHHSDLKITPYPEQLLDLVPTAFLLVGLGRRLSMVKDLDKEESL